MSLLQSEPELASRSEQLTLPQALAQVTALLEAQQVDEAERLCQAILAHWPEQPDAIHYLGLALHAKGDAEAGLALVRRAVELLPRHAAPCNNLGNLLMLSGRTEEAAEAYRQSLAREPNAVEAMCNLASAMRKIGCAAEGEKLCRAAIALKPDFGNAWYVLSRVLIERGEIAEGLQAHSRAVALWPRHQQARDAVIRALSLIGELDQAAELYREWLKEEPGNPVLLHQLAACTQGEVPPRASNACITQIFDSFATSFDAKLDKLGYRAPQCVADALLSGWPAAARQFTIADVGCGTGLVGPLLRGHARQLAGCDLSVGMLRQAKRRGCYDVLHQAELVYYLRTQPATFDAVVSADTLCYFGDLHEAAAAAAQALRAGGAFVFTVEALADDDALPHRLQPNGRYAHSRRHVASAIREAGLTVEHIRNEGLRMEAGRAVRGWLAVGRKAGAAQRD